MEHILQSFSDCFAEVMVRGGPIMWPLFICSVAAAAIIVERAIIFFICSRRAEKASGRIESVYGLILSGKTREAEELARDAGPIGEIIAEALSRQDMMIEDALESAGGQFISALKRHMPLLDTIITLSPMLGILGTVTGIIRSFSMLDLTGTTDPAAISGGIAEALITTAAGLSIAIACLVPFNFFKFRLTDWAKRIDHAARRCLAAYSKGISNGV